MGTADLVPGVSGGTIALVLGIYERLVTSIREGSSALGSLLKGDLKAFRRHFFTVEWAFLLPLLGGILMAVIALSSFLEHQLEERPTALAALFLGLVLGSVVIAWRLVRRREQVHYLIAAVVGIALFVALGLGEAGAASDPGALVFFAAGALAICAMILPGISGSLILVLIGMYSAVLAAVNDREFATIAIFAAGAIVGLALFSQILHWALSRFHDLVLAGLVGLMAGSLRILWPWPDGVDGPLLDSPADDWPAALLAVIVGLAAVVAISRLAAGEEEPG
jgi:putative membrane protein